MRFGMCEDCGKPLQMNPARQPRDNECKCGFTPPAHKSEPSTPGSTPPGDAIKG